MKSLKTIEEQLVEASRQTGARVLQRLQALKREFPDHVRAINGLGLLISIHLKRPDDGKPAVAQADAIAIEAVRRGLLMFTTGRGYLKFTPPLCINPEAAMEAVDVIGECFGDMLRT